MENKTFDFSEVINYIKENDIKLSKPIVFFDLESTGIDILTDRIIEVDAVKIKPDYTTEEYYTLVNPEMHIPDNASDVNSICDDDVKESPTFTQIADNVLTFFNNCDLGGYNIMGFDIPLLIEECKRAGKKFKYGNRRIIDALKILVKAEPRDLKHVYETFTGKELQNSHKARIDNMAAASVAFRQIGKYNLGTLDALSKFGSEGMVDVAGFFKRDKNNTIVFGIGKYKGRSVVDVYKNAGDSSYFEKYIKVKCGSDVNNHLNLIISGEEK